MFATIPLSIAFVSLCVIAYMVWRKMPFLRKLTPESHEVGSTVLHDFAPELIDWFRSIPWRQYVRNVLVELEKVLRHGRTLMSSLDRASDKVIRKVRRVHEETERQQKQIVAERKEEVARREEEPDEIDMADPEQVKLEEQRLIVAIAQNPKDVGLYSSLARVYMRMQNYGDAVEALSAAVKLDPESDDLKRRLERAERRKEKADLDAASEIAESAE